VDRRRELEERAAELSKTVVVNKAMQEAQRQAEEQEKASRAQMLRNLSAEIRAVEVQHKAKVAAAKAASEAAHVAKQVVPAPVSELPAPGPSFSDDCRQQDYQLQLRLLEQQNKKRFTHACRVQERPEPSALVEAPAGVVIKEQPQTEGSGMIFPTLEKESPTSSTHDVAATESSALAEAKPATTASSIASELEIFEDAESLELIESSDEDDGFLTDEEYDILNASDEETLA
jgi:next-to-BRCA1 protein 1